MILIESVKALQNWRKAITGNIKIGFVPTMGALHEGHASLLNRARRENDVVVLSIFVNPTQFNNPDDLKNYPKTWEQDHALARAHQVDVIFAPRSMEELYPDAYQYQLTEKSFSKELCGAHRPGHFDGVLTVVLKLFNLVKPTRAYFGEKDYQQLTLIQGMVKALFLDVDVVPCPTVRDTDGLAKSSRNLRLSHEERVLAPTLYQLMKQAKEPTDAITALKNAGFEVEYLEDRPLPGSARTRRFAAAWLGKVRLIDNVER